MCLASPFSGNDNRPAASRQKSVASRQKRGGQCCPPRGFSMKIRVVSYCFSRFFYFAEPPHACPASVWHIQDFPSAHPYRAIAGMTARRHYVPYPLLSGKPNVSHRKVSLDSNGFLSKKRRLVVEKNKKSAAVLHRLPASLICLILRHSHTRFYA